ncbi:MAG: hypothetical protein GYA17_09685 [Chloroflexi bacterium]|nr:DUF5692 family protein [Anaerolineaceae bacterium]NMB88620.1 hypothetical protein [Chloroflexota bacterium]
MFLFEPVPWYSVLMWFGVLAGLILLNELARLNKWFALAIFLVLPAILPFTVWKYTAVPGSSVGTWFHWAKVYSSLAGCLGFLALRHIKSWGANKYALLFPPLILAINILEAVVRDFQSFGVNGLVDGVYTIGGPWNIMNGVAGLINIITITGWMGIFMGKDQKKDMLWPDMLWFWVIAYDLWNFAYVYNCVSDHAFYAGAALLISCTIPAFFIKKGAWLQHRAQTLGVWMIFVMTFPNFVDTSVFAVKSSHSVTALWVVSGLALAANLAVLAYEVYTVFKTQRNPFKEEIYTHLPAYQQVAALRLGPSGDRQTDALPGVEHKPQSIAG